MKKVYYKLTPSQNIEREMLYFGKTQMVSIPFYFVFDEIFDLEKLRRAAELEFERNDSLSLRFSGNVFSMKQYFDSEKSFEGKIKVYDFSDKTEEEEMSVLNADAKGGFRYKKGETARCIITRTHDGKTGIYFNAFHLIMDAVGILVTVKDIVEVYDAIVQNKELPEPLFEFEKKIIEENAFCGSEMEALEKKRLESYYKEAGRPFFAPPWGIEKLKKLRAKKKDENLCVYNVLDVFNLNAESYMEKVPGELSEKMLSYCEKNSIPLQSLFMFGYRTYCSAVNERNSAVVFNSIIGRRKSKSDKKTGGCMMHPLTFWENTEEGERFKDAASRITLSYMKLMRAGDLTHPGDVINKLYGGGKTDDYGAMMFSYVPHPGIMGEGHKYSIVGINTGYFIRPIYALVSHDIFSGAVGCNYIYQPAMISDRNVRELHENALRVIMAGIDNPDVTVGELLDMVESEHINK